MEGRRNLKKIVGGILQYHGGGRGGIHQGGGDLQIPGSDIGLVR